MGQETNTKVLIDKGNGMPINKISVSKNKEDWEIKEYNINNVTDEDIAMPDIKEFEIKEIE